MVGMYDSNSRFVIGLLKKGSKETKLIAGHMREPIANVHTLLRRMELEGLISHKIINTRSKLWSLKI